MDLEVGVPKLLSASANVKATQGKLLGVFCTTTSSGTLILYNSATTTTTDPITGTITLTAGTFYRIPVAFADGLYAVIANTASITVIYA